MPNIQNSEKDTAGVTEALVTIHDQQEKKSSPRNQQLPSQPTRSSAGLAVPKIEVCPLVPEISDKTQFGEPLKQDKSSPFGENKKRLEVETLGNIIVEKIGDIGQVWRQEI